MEIKQAKKENVNIKIAITGCSSSGKTYSSLLLAHGLSEGNLNKVVVIDSEAGSSNLYSSLGQFSVLQIESPYTPEKYIQAIDFCVSNGFDVLILDSISKCWEELLQYHSTLQGNSFVGWGKVSPRQNAFVNAILQANAHIILTIRTKQDYILNLKNGVYVPQKVGFRPIQRQDIEYEPDLVFSLNAEHKATVTKNRTGLFLDTPEFAITSETGQQIRNWCNGEGIEKPAGKEKVGNLQPLMLGTEANQNEKSDPAFVKNSIIPAHGSITNRNNVSPFNFRPNGNTQN
jgi:hypothetical protein